jgi:hypothetical protein
MKIINVLGLSVISLMLMSIPFGSVESLDPMKPKELSKVNGSGGLGIQFNIQLDNGGFQIKDNDGRFGDPDNSNNDQGWLLLNAFSADISPTNANDNTIYLDANSEYIQFTAPNPITGSLSIEEIGVGQTRTSGVSNIAAFYVGDHSDGKASFNFNDTKLKLY